MSSRSTHVAGRRVKQACPVVLALLGCCGPVAPAGAHDIEFVSEHLVEVAMDHRYAALPVWPSETGARRQFTAQAGYSATRTGELELSGPTFSMGVHRSLHRGWTLSGFAFFDDLQFSGRNDHRPLDVGFVANVPLSLPADAVFTNLGGSSRETGLGMSVSRFIEDGRLAGWRWTAGALWQRLELSNYSSPYVVLAGPSTGATGIDRLQLEVVVHHALRRSFPLVHVRPLDHRAALPRRRAITNGAACRVGSPGTASTSAAIRPITVTASTTAIHRPSSASSSGMNHGDWKSTSVPR